MNKTLRDATLSSLLLLCFVFITSYANAQTPGLIYKIATNGGNKILDPNGDGYISKTNLGFQLVGGNRLDEGPEYSEIPYRPFPVFMDEPLADLKTGGSYGHTDFAPKVYANGQLVGSPMASYYDGKNFLFRVRLAGQSTASKGYSILIDTNNTLTGTGINPGFEFEVLLATNFDVRVYDYRTNPNGSLIFSGSVDQYSQKAIAGSTGGGDADYFYDFYAPISAFAGGITDSTPLRMTGVTVTSAKSGIFGVASDLGGVDDNAYSGTPIVDIWKSIITNTPVSTPTDIKDMGFTPVTASAPKVNSPIYTNSTTITGSTIEIAGSVITVYKNGTSIGTTTIDANGFWSLSTSGITLALNDAITAKVKPSMENESPSSTSVLVQSAYTVYTPCSTPAPVITGVMNNKKGLILNIPVDGNLNFSVRNPDGTTTTYLPYAVTAQNGREVPFTSTGNDLGTGIYYVTLTPTGGGCTSIASNQYCYQSGNTGTDAQAPTLSSPLNTSSTSLTVTFTIAGSTVQLIQNGVTVSPPFTTSGTTVTYNISGLNLRVGDIFQARVTIPGSCQATSARSAGVTVQAVQSSSPTITGTYCSATTIVTGTSVEAAGTIIKVYVGTTQVGTTTVNANGSWTATITSQTSGTLTATAAATNKSVSATSAGVTINGVPSNAGLAITGTSTGTTIYEGSTSVTGSYNTANGSVITLYINGQAYVDKEGKTLYATVSGSTFTFSGISPFELYAGAKLRVSVKASAGSTCESAQSAEVIVACNPAATTMTATFTAAKFCPNTPAYIKLSTSEAGVIYNIYKKNADNSYTQFGPSVLGTGSAITLQSNPVTTAGTIVQVKTIKVGAPCQYTIGGDMTVDLYPEVPKTFTVTATPDNSNCANVPVTITVQAAEAGYSYQLIINNTTKDKIGNPIVPTANGNISFPAQIVSKTTEYGVVITSTSTGCVTENTLLKTITISGGPDVNRAVTVNKPVICAGTSAIISVETQGSTFTYKIYQEGNATALATFAGTNAKVDRTLTTPFTTTGVKNFYVTVSETNGCSDLMLTQKVSITVTDGTGGVVTAGPDAISCGSTYTLAGNNPSPGTGSWTIVLKPATATNLTITSPTAYNSTVTGLVSGNYTFKWSVTPGCNAGAIISDEVTITINCFAEYSLAGNKPIPDYADGEVIGTVTDPEGIQSAQLVAGKGSLPPGIKLNTTTGALSVSDRFSLASNNYNFVVRITDNVNRTTDIPLALRFYSSSIRPIDITPLPVELVSFTATTDLKGVILQWMTASELDNDRFEIERSEDGKSFSNIGTVTGNGTSNRKIKYSFTDTKPLPEVSYYRLKQVDFDGTYKYSKIISVKNKALLASTILEAYPNPFVEKLSVTITVPASETEATLTLYNLQGRRLQTIKTALEKGMNTFELNTQQLASGVYIIRITGNSSDVSAKVLKK
ncbi:T9SS type A sorting domain-containing protein [Pontibacter sp. BT310]|uniref:T9SS type A sorting domain-containing protein n=1 Tax=Pontibacter populi TaxID=890055 RepID=A0ABS6XBS1_9BACT|nr:MULTISPECIES: T9SS type A sorting domain-containing protein [Pontibacter]MBJ6118590.1 T9SS type A sorting domain-containing protein [Pontibacter sp. BT310]MBR0571019.1 T9SS type A sorting domain-containing protein [Microvirga sp. STS03]MBW3365444.1 T9SS type A sorting domain-containing protein [Pontibacter populi]